MTQRQVLFLICLLLAMTTTRPATAEPPAVTAYRQAHEAEILRDFAELLRMPNVASDAVNIRRNAEYLKRQLERRGARADLMGSLLTMAPPG